MKKIDWVEKTKDYILAAVCTALVTIVVSGAAMLLRHDKKLNLLDYKVNIVLRHVAPEVDIPTVDEETQAQPVQPVARH